MGGNVKLVQGAQFRYQNAFRTISFGYAPYLPMTQSYKMGLDEEFAGRGSAYFSLYPQDFSSSNDNRDGYSWMQRRFAYNAGGSGRLSSLNGYSRQRLALGSSPKGRMATSSTAMASELSQLISRTNAIGERQFTQSDISELEMLIIGRYAESGDEKDIQSQGGNAILKPNDYANKMGLGQDSELRSLSSQSFDMLFANEPGTHKLITGLMGQAGAEAGGKTRATRLADSASALEMGAGNPQNKFLTKTTQSEVFKNAVDGQKIFAANIKSQLDKVNQGIVEKHTETDSFATMGAIDGDPLINWSALSSSTLHNTHKTLHAKFRVGTKNTRDSEARRLLSRGQDLLTLHQTNAKKVQPGGRFIEHQNLNNGYQGFAVIQPTMRDVLGQQVPQFEAIGVYVLPDAVTLASAARSLAKTTMLKNNEDVDKAFNRLAQVAIDESTKIASRVAMVSSFKETAGISNIVDGMHINVHDAGGYAGIIGLSEKNVAKGLEVKIRRAVEGKEFQQQFGNFYSKMMSQSNKLSTQWKRAVPKGTTSQALQSEEWTFGDGRQSQPPGGPRKRYLGIWGPTGDASGEYDNWKDSNRVTGENVSVSPFLTSRRLGTASFRK